MIEGDVTISPDLLAGTSILSCCLMEYNVRELLDEVTQHAPVALQANPVF